MSGQWLVISWLLLAFVQAQGKTTIRDNFNRTDSSTLGTSGEGWSWSEVENSGHGIVSNQARSDGASLNQRKVSRADSDLSVDDHYCQVTVTTLPQPTSPDRAISAGCAFRVSNDAAPNHDYYSVRLMQWDANCTSCANGQQNISTNRVLNGAETELANVGISISLPDTIRLEVSGSTLKMFLNGVQQGSDLTDSNFSGQLRPGLIGFNRSANYEMDDFEAGDLALFPPAILNNPQVY